MISVIGDFFHCAGVISPISLVNCFALGANSEKVGIGRCIHLYEDGVEFENFLVPNELNFSFLVIGVNRDDLSIVPFFVLLVIGLAQFVDVFAFEAVHGEVEVI